MDIPKNIGTLADKTELTRYTFEYVNETKCRDKLIKLIDNEFQFSGYNIISSGPKANGPNNIGRMIVEVVKPAKMPDADKNHSGSAVSPGGSIPKNETK